MHSYRFRYIVLGLLIYIQSAFCQERTCGYEFNDVASRVYNADIVFEGKFLGKYEHDGTSSRFNASFRVIKVHKGSLPKSAQDSPMGKYRPVIAGDFGPIDKDECVTPIHRNASLHSLIVFLKNNTNPSVPIYRISGFPEKSSKKALRAIRGIQCGSQRCAPKTAKAEFTTKKEHWSVGRTVTLRCKISGNPPPTVRWYKDHNILESGGRIAIRTNRRSSRLRIKRCTEEDKGIYYCQANNQLGQATVDTMVAVEGKTMPDEHSEVCPQQNYCLNGGSCFFLQELGTKFCKCQDNYTGRRCQLRSPILVTEPNLAEKRDAHQFDRTMTITCIIIGALVLAAMCITAYCMAKQKRDKFHRKKAERERQKAAANSTYQKIPKETTTAPAFNPPRTSLELKPLKTTGSQTENHLPQAMFVPETAALLSEESAFKGQGQSNMGNQTENHGRNRGHSRSNSQSGQNYVRHSDRPTDRHSDRPTDRHSDRPADRHSDRHADRHSDRHADRHSDRHADRHSDQQSDHHSDRHSDRSDRHSDKRSDHHDDRHSDHHSDRYNDRHRDRSSDRHSDRCSDRPSGRYTPQHYEGSPPGSIDRLSQYGGSVSGSERSHSRQRLSGRAGSSEGFAHSSRSASNPRVVNAVVESDHDTSKRSSPSQNSRTESTHGGGYEQAAVHKVRRANSETGSRGSRGSRGSKRSLELGGGDHSDYDNPPSDLEVNMESEVDMHGLDASGDEVEGQLPKDNGPIRGEAEIMSSESETSESESSSSGPGEEAALFEKLKHNPRLMKQNPGKECSSAGNLSWDEYGNDPSFANQQYAFNPYAIDADVIDNKYFGSNPGSGHGAQRNHKKSKANNRVQDGLLHHFNDDPDATPV